ncbi:MAG: hypothetical protein SW833_25280 [Cyanobacteriota bacterium]|nr:hypothetical protein [Cyanobacteriota bacterium]
MLLLRQEGDRAIAFFFLLLTSVLKKPARLFPRYDTTLVFAPRGNIR